MFIILQWTIQQLCRHPANPTANDPHSIPADALKSGPMTHTHTHTPKLSQAPNSPREHPNPPQNTVCSFLSETKHNLSRQKLFTYFLSPVIHKGVPHLPSKPLYIYYLQLGQLRLILTCKTEMSPSSVSFLLESAPPHFFL